MLQRLVSVLPGKLLGSELEHRPKNRDELLQRANEKNVIQWEKKKEILTILNERQT